MYAIRMIFGLRLVLFLLILAGFSSCYKEQTTMTTIIVRDSSGNLVEGAQVNLIAEPTVGGMNEVNLDLEKISNNKGEAYFNLTNIYEPGQNGVGIFAVYCQKFSSVGEGTIEVQQEMNNLCEIIIN